MGLGTARARGVARMPFSVRTLGLPAAGLGRHRGPRALSRKAARRSPRERDGGARHVSGQGLSGAGRKGGRSSRRSAPRAPATVRAGGALPALHRASRPGLEAWRARRRRGGSFFPQPAPTPSPCAGLPPVRPRRRAGGRGRPRASRRRRRRGRPGGRPEFSRGSALLGAREKKPPGCREGGVPGTAPPGGAPRPFPRRFARRATAGRPAVAPVGGRCANGEGAGCGGGRLRGSEEAAPPALPAPGSGALPPGRVPLLGRAAPRSRAPEELQGPSPPGVPGRAPGCARARKRASESRSAVGPRPRAGGAGRAAAVLSGAAPGY